MVGHIMQPAYSRKLNPFLKDEEILPATLSYELVTNLLKEQLGFNGLVVTDATTMAGMVIPVHRSEAVPMAIAAGCDMFLFTRNLEEDFQFMKQGIKDGIITKERLHDALTKILGMKAALGLHKQNEKLLPQIEKAQQVIGTKEHLNWAHEAADQSITLVKNKEDLLPLSVEKHKRVLLYPIESGDSFFAEAASNAKDEFIDLLEKEGFIVELFNPSVGMEGILAPYKQAIDKYDLIIYLANMSTKSNQTVVRIEWAQPLGVNVPVHIASIPTLFVSVENPYHLIDVPRVKTYINTYYSSPLVIHHLVEKLMGRSDFKGKSPVDAFCGKWDAEL
jgi:beta-N-acetylhexosaminidase